MCDYSLMGVENRLAAEGEDLVAHRFSTYSLGLTSAEYLAPKADSTRRRSKGIWSILNALFTPERAASAIAVCIPPGSRLLLQDIPAELRRSLGVGATEEVTFTQATAEAYTHRDAVRFGNGYELSLQSLAPGQRVKVLSLAASETSAPEAQLRMNLR